MTTNTTRRIWCCILPTLALTFWLVSSVIAAEPEADSPKTRPSGWLAMVANAADKAEADKTASAEADNGAVKGKLEDEEAPAAWDKPITVGVTYWMVSDYVFRGINLSEYPHEGREKLNYQFQVNPELDLKKLTKAPLGNIGANFWFEWYTAQKKLTPWTNDNLQEVDYTVYYKYPIESLGLTPEVGWIAYTYPPMYKPGARTAGISSDAANTYEWYAKLSFDDSKLFGKPILSPYVSFNQDVDLGKNGSWIEFGVSHGFALSEFGMKETPFFKDLTITPSVVLGIDNRYLDKYAFNADGTPGQAACRLGTLVYGLEALYDISAALKMPAKYGSLKAGGFVNYSDALRSDLLNDQFYGGLKVSYGW